MTGHESPQPISDGERWLNLIDYGHFKGQPTEHVIDGKPVLAEEFDLLCDEHARPIFEALEMLDPNATTDNIARNIFRAL